jgi:hypothetical protein
MNRLEWILGIVLVLLLIGVAVLSLVFWFGPDRAANGPAANSATVLAQRADDIAPTSVFTGDTAKVAYAKAQQTAAAWHPDAKLLNLSATWPQGASIQDLQNGQATWGFTFYSPSAEQIAVISVVEENATIVSQGEHTQTAPILEATGWNLDSSEVIGTMLNQGGSQFISDEGVITLMMMLDADNDTGDGRLEWQINLISLQNGRALKMLIDATSGEILENETVP